MDLEAVLDLEVAAAADSAVGVDLEEARVDAEEEEEDVEVEDTLVADTLVVDTLVVDTLVADTLVADTQLEEVITLVADTLVEEAITPVEEEDIIIKEELDIQPTRPIRPVEVAALAVVAMAATEVRPLQRQHNLPAGESNASRGSYQLHAA